MREAARNLFVNLTGALVVGLTVASVLSVNIGGPPFRELFLPNFLRAFVPYFFATLLALKFTPRLGGRRVADYIFIPLVGSFLSLALFYHSNAGFMLPPVEMAPRVVVVLAVGFLAYAVFGVVALLTLRSVVSIFATASYRQSLR